MFLFLSCIYDDFVGFVVLCVNDFMYRVPYSCAVTNYSNYTPIVWSVIFQCNYYAACSGAHFAWCEGVLDAVFSVISASLQALIELPSDCFSAGLKPLQFF